MPIQYSLLHSTSENTPPTPGLSVSLGSLQRLRDYPAVEGPAVCREAQRIGAAGELFFRSCLTGLGFDLLDFPVASAADVGILLGDRCIRVQIKTVVRPTKNVYQTSFTRGYRNTGTGVYDYSPGDYDIGAAVLLTDQTIIYLPPTKRSVRIPVDRIPELQRTHTDRVYQALADVGALRALDIETIYTR
ncbi:MAG: hypothetical protein IKD58_07440 [Loktanella sp.]|nr:hypothetical protein [Loktanella sp.]